MSTTTLPPPSRFLSSQTASLTESHSFLTTFISTIESSPNTDLVLADQRRIAQALEGVYVPPAEVKPDNAPEEEDVVMGGMEEEQGEEDGGEDGNAEGEGKTVDKAKRKAEKKKRMAEEKRRRAEEREKAKAAEEEEA
ncbi:hypothetical protein EX30DRAFT_350274 [Ascodesmis nigricans]|uniref:Uncharacterized protein n=1 Tax=Ascodesmis nigricans TaxID=341454 RepID=A0A4S2MQ37_9PEZI|nr:hypothetical protein EX30DRAFT_350274 [Ascodesmis nigricans]